MEGLAHPFEAIAQFLSDIWDTLVDIGTYIFGIFDWLNPASENFFVYRLIELLRNMFSSLFVPSQDSVSSIQSMVMQKFQFIDSIKIAVNSLKDIINNIGEAPTLHLTLSATKYTQAGQYTVIDMNWYRPYKAYGDLVLTGLIYVFYLWRVFVRLPGIINGTSGDISTTTKISGGGN